MLSTRVQVKNSSGLHARACGKIVQTARRFACEVVLEAGGRRADARNIVAVMLLSASVGTFVQIKARGPEEVFALREIATLFQDRFGELG